MWLVADYQSAGLFSLKSSLATSSGAKSLLVPTPYAVKMALVDAACRLLGAGTASAMWPTIRDLQVALRPSERVVVTNLFAKMLKPRRAPAAPGAPDAGPLGRTIAFREYVWTEGVWSLALEPRSDEDGQDVASLLVQVNYLGKRGSFIQLLDVPRRAARLPADCVRLNPVEPQAEFDSRGLPQVLDDCGSQMTFEQADIYSGKGIGLGKERVFHHVILPYSLVRSSRGYSLYERFES
jgi:hypothetical protein